MIDILENLKKLVNGFSKKEIQIAIAESCTGGYISHMITNISGASKVYERGIVSYSNEAKIELLNINSEIIKQHGAVSEQVARKMADNVRILSHVDIGIGITGIAGPLGGTKDKPVGLVYMGFSTLKKTLIKKFVFKADRIGFKEMVLKEVVSILNDYLKELEEN